MRIFVSPTDHDWYTFLRDRCPDEVNFWRPSATGAFHALEPGEPFLFKAKAPHSGIIGGGFFLRYVSAPVSLAWQAFGENNGTPDVRTFLERIRKYRGDISALDPEVGCVLLNEPFFFPEELWIAEPEDWSRQIVRGKGYDASGGVGRRLWDTVAERLADPRVIMGPRVTSEASSGGAGTPPFVESERRFGEAYLAYSRLGQGAFRLGVLAAYEARCAETGERVRPVLEAAHIRPFSHEGPNLVSNGLSLRADIHKLFDLGYVTVDPNRLFHVSARLKADFDNGRDYYRFDGQPLNRVPTRVVEQPAREYLEWHNDVMFRP